MKKADALDLTAFDIDDINFRLKKVPTIYRKIYEDNRPPSREVMKILERKSKSTSRDAGSTASRLSNLMRSDSFRVFANMI